MMSLPTIYGEQCRTIVGIDPHKRTHSICVLNHRGKPIKEFEIGNSCSDFERLKNELFAGLSTENPKNSPVIVGLEDTEQYGINLAIYLNGLGIPVKVVNPIYTKRERFYSPEISKDDKRDAELTASVLWRELEKNTLPDFTNSDQANFSRDLKGIISDYRSLVNSQTRLKNQLHQLMNTAYGNCYEEFFSSPFSPTALEFFYQFPSLNCFLKTRNEKWQKIIVKNSHYRLGSQIEHIKKLKGKLREETIPALKASDINVSRLQRKITELKFIQNQAKETKEELQEIMDNNHEAKKLMKLNGVGLIIASIILSEVKDINRFNSDSKLASYSGCAPRKYGSGGKYQYYSNKRGNRKLNWAIHRMTLSQLGNRGTKETKDYFQKKLAMGKNKKQAFAAVKRVLVKIIYQTLKESIIESTNINVF